MLQIRYFRLDGKSKQWQRQAMMDLFNSINCKVCLCVRLASGSPVPAHVAYVHVDERPAA